MRGRRWRASSSSPWPSFSASPQRWWGLGKGEALGRQCQGRGSGYGRGREGRGARWGADSALGQGVCAGSECRGARGGPGGGRDTGQKGAAARRGAAGCPGACCASGSQRNTLRRRRPAPPRPQIISRMFYTTAHYKKAAAALEAEYWLLALSAPREEVAAAREASLGAQLAGAHGGGAACRGARRGEPSAAARFGARRAPAEGRACRGRVRGRRMCRVKVLYMGPPRRADSRTAPVVAANVCGHSAGQDAADDSPAHALAREPALGVRSGL